MRGTVQVPVNKIMPISGRFAGLYASRPWSAAWRRKCTYTKARPSFLFFSTEPRHIALKSPRGSWVSMGVHVFFFLLKWGWWDPRGVGDEGWGGWTRVRGRVVSVLPLRPFWTAQRASTPRCAGFVAVIVAGSEEPLWQQRGFGDICHFSESSSGCVRGGARGGVPVHRERSGMWWRAKNLSEMFVSGRVAGVIPQWLLPCTFLSMGLLCGCLEPLSEVDLRCEKTVSTCWYQSRSLQMDFSSFLILDS